MLEQIFSDGIDFAQGEISKIFFGVISISIIFYFFGFCSGVFVQNNFPNSIQYIMYLIFTILLGLLSLCGIGFILYFIYFFFGRIWQRSKFFQEFKDEFIDFYREKKQKESDSK